MSVSAERRPERVGPYRLVRLLGQGGFADVYLGKHLHLGTYAAIKMVRTHLEPEQIQRFRQEARTIARLDHPHIIRLLDYNVMRQGRPYLVMEYAPHGSLREHFPAGTRLSVRQVLPLFSELSSAVAYAHTQGVIHRDLKPENVLLGKQQHVLLSDFGLAIRDAAVSTSLSGMRPGQEVAGTVPYMAPEQFQGHATFASDQYALAVLCYEWLCGHHPFEGSFTEVAAQKLTQPPPALTVSLHPDVEQALLRALAADPTVRFPSVQEFAQALREALVLPFPSTGPHRLVSASTLHPSYSTRPLPRASDAQTSQPHPTPRVIPVTQPLAPPPPPAFSRRQVLTGAALVGGLATLGLGGAALAHLLAPSSTPAYSLPSEATPGTTPVSTPSMPVPTPSPTSTSTLAPSPTQKAQPPTPSPAPTRPPIGTKLLTYRGHTAPITSVVWSPDGSRLASASLDATVQVWDSTNGRLLLTYRGHPTSVQDLVWSPDGARLASASDTEVHLWSPVTGQRSGVYQATADHFHCLAWAPDGTRIAAGSVEGHIHVFQARSTAGLLIYQATTSSSYALAWAPDSTKIASCEGDGSLYLRQASTGTLLTQYPGQNLLLQSVAWAPGGDRLAAGGSAGGTLLWNASSTQLLRTLPMTPARTTLSLAWAPQGNQLATGTQEDAAVSLWNPTTGTRQFTFHGHSAPVTRVAWAPGGRRLASASRDATVLVWAT